MRYEQLFFITLASGALLFGAEVFVPGGILGIIGGIALITAAITGFYAFPDYGSYIAAGIALVSVGSIVLWIRIWPHTPLGKKMLVKRNLGDSKATEEGLDQLLNCEGITETSLRPAGYALINDERVDVITNGEMLAEHTPVKVIEVEGNRVVVEKI